MVYSIVLGIMGTIAWLVGVNLPKPYSHKLLLTAIFLELVCIAGLLINVVQELQQIKLLMDL